MADTYCELQIKINPAMEDIISDICFEYFPCEGIVLAEETYKDLEMVSTTEGTLRVFLNPGLCHSGQIAPSGSLRLSTECEEAHIKNVLLSQRSLLKSRGFSDEELGSWEFTIFNKQNEDWSKKWKEKWDVTPVSDRITVVPDWIEYSPHRQNEVIIKLEPGCAFGTGTHSTTQLCMKAIEKYMPENADVADIGTGSGILAICAVKFGAKYAYGCDNDETVIDVAKENAVKNGITLPTRPLMEREEVVNELCKFTNSGDGLCFFELNTADKITRQFDFVLANILHNVLAEIMDDLKNIMKDGACMVLSGILDEKKQVVLEAIKKHSLELIEEMHRNRWVALVVRKNKEKNLHG